MLIDKVVLQKKSAWQKDECLFCADDARLEAVYKSNTDTQYGASAHIRCCYKEECKNRAKELAVASIESAERLKQDLRLAKLNKLNNL